MMTLFNENWQFAELPLDYKTIHDKNGKPVLFSPEQFYEKSQNLKYKPVQIPHDWMIWHVKDLYKNSVGCYKKQFTLSKEQIENRRNVIRFEGIYMNCAIWLNGKKASEWKYGYATFEVDLTPFVKEGKNEILVLAVYEHCNTRWYSGAGIFRDVNFINTQKTFLPTDGLYIANTPTSETLEEIYKNDFSNLKTNIWNSKISVEVAGILNEHKVSVKIADKNGKILAKAENLLANPLNDDDEKDLQRSVPVLKNQKIYKAETEIQIQNPLFWDINSPNFYIATVELLDKNENVIDSISQHCGFKIAKFDENEGFFLNGRHLKIFGACHHHDHGALGSAFNKNALRRQFEKLQEMGVNSVRCSHNPPPKDWMDLCDEMGILVDDEAFDMWEKSKTEFDYGNYFNDWCERDTASWVRKDRNHPSLIMWSIGNEIYDTHVGNGYEITKKLYSYVVKNDPNRVAPITIASNYMMTDGAQKCATQIDTVGYNYLERLYEEHHKKYPTWKIYGSETGSTVQSRGIYHFPETLKLVTFSDGQCSALGNCTTTWGCANTQTVIANDRDCSFSAGQYIWTGWDYIGEPTPYHSKNSYFGQIDTAGFPKDTFYLYKSEWAGKNAKPFVHLLPYWDWNEGQIIDVKAYTNADFVELFFNEKSLGKQKINHKNGKEPFGRWQLAYHKGKIKAVAYDENGKIIASEEKSSFEDPAKIIIKPENGNFGDLFFVDLMTADKNDVLVENARNYITINVDGDAELVGMDNGDSTDYEEYKSEDGKTHSRKLFSNRLVAIIKAKTPKSSFVVTVASKDLQNVSVKFDGSKWSEIPANKNVFAQKDFVPTRKIEIIAKNSTTLTNQNREIQVFAKVLPENASLKEIVWSPVLKECVASDYIEVLNKTGEGSGLESATIKAVCDGECILRCTAKNGSDLDEVLSDLNFTVEGIGNPKLNPYKLIEACRFNDWDKSKQKPVVSLESGISNRFIGASWISFDKVDFGKEGADSIHIPIFSFDTELPVEIWDGKPAEGTTRDGAISSETGECLGKFTYKHDSIYNTYSENIFTLSKRLFGVHTISIVLPTELTFHGFYFDKTLKALSVLRALDADDIVGDTFTKTQTCVEGIGNNVNLDFANMNFGENKATKITICGKSNTENNTINLKFFGADGKVRTDVIEFSHTDDFEQKTFEIPSICGEQKVSFVFLPGCNFDFKWFKFE